MAFNAWRGRTDGPTLDYILAAPPPATEVVAAAIVKTRRDVSWPSDHFPVTAKVRVSYPHR